MVLIAFLVVSRLPRLPADGLGCKVVDREFGPPKPTASFWHGIKRLKLCQNTLLCKIKQKQGGSKLSLQLPRCHMTMPHQGLLKTIAVRGGPEAVSVNPERLTPLPWRAGHMALLYGRLDTCHVCLYSPQPAWPNSKTVVHQYPTSTRSVSNTSTVSIH